MPTHFTLAELTALPDVAAGVDTARVDAIEADLVGTIEREIRAPLAPATVTVAVTVAGTGAAVLPHSDVRSVTGIVRDGVPLPIAGVTSNAGILRPATPSTWSAGELLEVTYTHGPWATCPPDLKEPLLWAVRDRVLAGGANAGADARRTSVTTEFGTTNYVLPGEKRPTGYPALDAAIAGYERTSIGDFA